MLLKSLPKPSLDLALWVLLLVVLFGLMFANLLKTQAGWIVPASAVLGGLFTLRLAQPWRTGALALLLWGIGEGFWVLQDQNPLFLPVADGLYVVGYLLWYIMFAGVKNTRPPRLVWLLTLPVVCMELWLFSQTPKTNIAVFYPLLDCLLLVTAAPAAQAFLEGRAPLSRSVWLITFHGMVLIDTLYAMQRAGIDGALNSVDYLAYSVLYLSTGLGLYLEARNRRLDVKPLVLAVFVIVAMRFLINLDEASTVVDQVLSWTFFYVTFAALTGMVVSFMNHHRLAHERYREYATSLKRILVPFQQRLTAGGVVTHELDLALQELQIQMPELQGLTLHTQPPYQWGKVTQHQQHHTYQLPEWGPIEVGFHLQGPDHDPEALEATQDAVEHLLLFADHHRMAVSRANTDPLTGLSNRRSALPAVQRLLTRASVKQHPLVVVMLDLDHFKRINDQHGHSTGDQVLTLFGQVLTQSIREQDLSFRWGGEEFLLVFPNVPLEVAQGVLHRLSLTLQEQALQQLGFRVTFSAGLYGGVPQQADVLEPWVEQADQLLLQAKNEGRNRVKVGHAGA